MEYIGIVIAMTGGEIFIFKKMGEWLSYAEASESKLRWSNGKP
jgi:hypothetical protein